MVPHTSPCPVWRCSKCPGPVRWIEDIAAWRRLGKRHTLEHYDRYYVYRGETQDEGAVFISLGWAVRCGAWGADRLYVVSFLSQRAPQTPLAEFLAADDYAETGELIAVIRGSDGGRRMYGPTEVLPPAYAQFRIVTYRDRVQARGAWNKLAVRRLLYKFTRSAIRA